MSIISIVFLTLSGYVITRSFIYPRLFIQRFKQKQDSQTFKRTREDVLHVDSAELHGLQGRRIEVEGTRSYIEVAETAVLHVKNFQLLERCEGSVVEGKTLLVVASALQRQDLRRDGSGRDSFQPVQRQVKISDEKLRELSSCFRMASQTTILKMNERICAVKCEFALPAGWASRRARPSRRSPKLPRSGCIPSRWLTSGAECRPVE